MKQYVIFGWAAGIAGGQLYTDAKCSALQSRGYSVCIIYSGTGEVVLPSIRASRHISIPQIIRLPSDFFSFQREEIIQTILAFISACDSETVLIESNGVVYSYWAELVASRLNVKHFAYCLEAHFDLLRGHQNINYLLFKLNRKEIAGTRESSLYHLLGANYINENNNRFFTAYTASSVADIPYDCPVLQNHFDFIISYIGRETKPCFSYIKKGVLDFCKQYPKLTFLFFCIGCKNDGIDYEKTKLEFSACPNVSFYFTNPLFPIPLAYITNSDICIGSSGSADAAAEAGCRTIKYLDNEPYPLGVIGYDILSKDDESRHYFGELSNLIDDVLFNGYCDRFSFVNVYDTVCDSIRTENLLRDSAEMMAPCELAFFDTSKIKRRGMKWGLKSLCHRIVHLLR